MDRFCDYVASQRLTPLSNDQFDGYGVIRELGMILRGEHPNWKGDRRENGYWFLKIIRGQFASESASLAIEIEHNLEKFCCECNISPRSATMAELVLRGELLSM